ncbi:uncharacterized protein F4822DRAFT_426777 [Hypoxylon trugodes]|uniref:uncharacterized protein n=1 Tax=Hypoxylon trugodes TaxID=326681 RepID=UPI0021A071A4|nr:uncharacterized protein F4822DRAFT_426777 [Hypoxylon trugodes]KAI1390927.1 hypothetical protein F4822DRAFT_426777 [Hypoxylon trugodes]
MNVLDHVSRARTHLEQKRKDAEDKLIRLQEKMAKKISKLQQLHRQEDLLKRRGLELLKLSKEQDTEEEQAHLAEEQAHIIEEQVQVKRGHGIPTSKTSSLAFPSSLSGINFDLGPMSPSTAAVWALVGQGFGGENPQSTSGPHHS